MNQELELKFGVPAEALDSLRQALLERGAAQLRLQARYFDTPDGRLAAQRVALRMRQEGNDWVQTLKADGDSAVSRLEHEARVPVDADGVPCCCWTVTKAPTPTARCGPRWEMRAIAWSNGWRPTSTACAAGCATMKMKSTRARHR